MRKVIGIGETILDIIFRNGQPTAAVPGGSVFNGVVSLARAGVPVSFISETGNDRVGNTILQSMRDSGMSTDYVNVFPDGKSRYHWPILTRMVMRNTSSTKIIPSNGWTWFSQNWKKTTSWFSAPILP